MLRLGPARIGLVAAAMLLVVSAPTAHAGVYLNTVSPSATISGAGHRVTATVIVGCDVGERLRFQVSVMQGDTVGIGHGAARCTGDAEGDSYEVTVAATRGDTFEAGHADVEAWAETRHGQHTHPRRTWSTTIELE